MPSSDYNKYLAAIKAANDMENKELLRQIKNELIANYGLMDDDVDAARQPRHRPEPAGELCCRQGGKRRALSRRRGAA